MEKLEEAKLIVVGETNVGKTSLIKQYIDNIFSEEKIATVGYDTITKEIAIEDRKIKLNIWDTCGQEQYRTINQMFVKNSKIALLVYDITQKDTFNELKNYWYTYITTSLGKNIIIGIAGNKCDLYEDEQVKTEEGKEYAESIGAIFKETTAKNNEAISQLIELLTKKYIETIGNVKNINSNYVNKNKENKGVQLNKENVTKSNKKKGCCKNS